MHYCNAMILRLSVTLVDKINNAKPDALLFADGQGIFNRQFFSLMLMTNYLIGIKSNSLDKNAKHNSISRIWNRLGQLSLALNEAYQHKGEQRFRVVELLENNTSTPDGDWAIRSSFPNQNTIATKLCFATRFGLNTWITGQRELGGRTDPRRKHHNGRLGDNDQRRQHEAWSLCWTTVQLVRMTGN